MTHKGNGKTKLEISFNDPDLTDAEASLLAHGYLAKVLEAAELSPKHMLQDATFTLDEEAANG